MTMQIDRPSRSLTPNFEACRALQRSLSPALSSPNLGKRTIQNQIPNQLDATQHHRNRRRSITISSDAAGDLAVVNAGEKPRERPAAWTIPYQYAELKLSKSPAKELGASPRLLPNPIASPLLAPRDFHEHLDLAQIPSIALEEGEGPDMFDLMAVQASQTQPVAQTSWLSRSKLKLFANEVSNASSAAFSKGATSNKVVTGMAIVAAAGISGESGGRSIPLSLLKRVMGDD